MMNNTPAMETPTVEPMMKNKTTESNATGTSTTNSGVVTTDGAKPFDISSMFANNE